MLGTFSSRLQNELDDERDANEFNPFVPLAAVLILFIISGVLSYNEFKYAVWGRSADAEVVQIKETPFGTGVGIRAMVEVRYQWTDADDGERVDSFLRDPAEWKHAVGDRFAIEYLPGVMKSRVAGRPTYATVAMWFFFGLGGIALVLFVMLWRQGMRKGKVGGV